MSLPSKRDLEIADELQRAARQYQAKAQVCINMAGNLLAGRSLADGLGQLDRAALAVQAVHELTDERQPATGEDRPPARGG